MPRKRRWVLREGLLALLAVAALAAWWALRETGAGTRSAPAEPGAQAEETGAPAAGPALLAGQPDELPAPAESMAEEAPPAEEDRRAASATAFGVAGTIVVVGSDGVEYPAENGSMTIFGGSQDIQPPRVEIAAGRWTAAAKPGDQLTFEAIVLGGRRAVSLHPDPLAVPISGRVDVRARWPEGNVLRVRSAATHADLTGVDVVVRRNWGRLEPVHHPGGGESHQVLVSGATSPIDLDRAGGPNVIWGQVVLLARAEGYAWKGLVAEFDEGGERVIDLVPSGSLRVAFAGDAPSKAILRLRREGEAVPLLEDTAKGRERVLDSLVPGAYTVALEAGDWFRNPWVFASSRAEVSAGSETRVELEAAETTEVASVRLRGVLVVDPAWGALPPELDLERRDTLPDGSRFELALDTDELVPSASESSWVFDAGDVPCGPYELRVEPHHHRQQLAIDETTGDLRIEVPAPATAAFRVLDASGRELKEPRSLSWLPLPEGAEGGSSASVGRDPASGRFEIRAVVGRLAVLSLDGAELQGQTVSVGRDPASGRFEIRAAVGRLAVLSLDGAELQGQTVFDLQPGRQELDLVAGNTCGFLLELRAGEATVPWAGTWKESPHQAGGTGAFTGFSFSMHMAQGSQSMTTRVQIRVSHPGRYRFSLPDLDGYEPLPEQEVVVPAGGFIEHVVELVRAR